MADLYRPRFVPPKTLSRARAMRREMTDVERTLWYKLRDRTLVGYKFRRQVPIGQYIVDFCCVEERLIVELDGEQHFEKTKSYDDARTKELEERAFRVIRFWNHQVIDNLDGVLAVILGKLEERGGRCGNRSDGQCPHLPRFARHPLP